MRAKRETLSGWGRYRRAEAAAFRPEDPLGAARALAAGVRPVLPVGGFRSYGDQALNDGGAVVRMERLNRFLALDAAAPAVECEAGVTFGDLLSVLLPHGLAAPVSPGTRFATLGGAVANDVHGKNHDRAGSLGAHLDWIDLLTADGAVRRVGPDREPALFAATLGGCGLTGIVLRARLRLKRVPSGTVAVRETRLGDLDGLMAALASARESAEYTVAWVDALAGGGRLGRGILEAAEHADDARAPADPREGARLRLPVDCPGWALNRATVRAFNALYWRRVPAAGRARTVPLARFLYPLDAIGAWNRLYGRRGFHQFQCVLPDGDAPRGLARILERTRASGRASFLAVLKTLGGEGIGHLSFPRPGFTLALDIPERPGSRELLGDLERLTLEHGGRLYLAKDSALSPDGLAAMYPRLEAFRAVLAEVDPQARFGSDMARRLNLRGERA